jgi:hypothetical protein
MRRLCPVIVPVAGLLGNAAVSLRESEFRALAVLAAAPHAEVVLLLLTADRFAGRPSSVQVTELERQHLLGRFGLFGVRLCVELIRAGEVRSATALSQELARRSGLDKLRTVLLRQFTERSRILKAHSALTALESILRAGGCRNPDGLRAAAEQITSGAHAFEEVRLLDQLRTHALDVPERHVDELDRLLGGSGHDPVSRLDLTENASPSEITEAALAALSRWQSLAEHPMSPRNVQLAARGASRTLEGILAQLTGALKSGASTGRHRSD